MLPVPVRVGPCCLRVGGAPGHGESYDASRIAGRDPSDTAGSRTQGVARVRVGDGAWR